jgi:porin
MRTHTLAAACARHITQLCLVTLVGLYIPAAAAAADIDTSSLSGTAMDAMALDSLSAEPQAQTGVQNATPPGLPAPAAPPADPYARFSKYITKGLNVPIPGPAAYIDPDPKGLRSRLDDNGWGYWGYSLNALTYDVRNHGHTDNGNQVYSGQKSTLTSYNYLYTSYDLSRHGIENGQLSAALVDVYTNWKPAGPNMVRLGMLQYYQTFGGGRVELALGNLGSSFTYVGTYVGGNLASGTFGVNASIPSQVGMSSTFLARPGVNVKINFGNGFYDMFGYHRSVNPDGSAAEQNANPYGPSLAGDHVGNLWVNEFGFRRKASPQDRDTWVRAGYIRNYSDYQSKKTPGTRQDDNHAAYLLADRQLFRLGDTPAQAGRGIYGGFSYMYAPADINTFTEYDELRIYAKGPFDARPNDMLSFVISRNVFSEYAIRNARAVGIPTEHESTAVSLSYSGSVARGVTLTGGFSYINHPRPVTTSDTQESGLNLQLGAHIYF